MSDLLVATGGAGPHGGEYCRCARSVRVKLQPAAAHTPLPSCTVSAVTICRTVQRARGQAADTITPRRRKPTLREGLRTDIPHIRLRVSKEPATLHDGYGRGIHERRQLSHRAHKTISRCRELVSARQRRRLSARLHTLQLSQAHSSPLATPVTSDDPKDTRYPGAGWSPPIRSSTRRNTSRGTATSAS